MDINTVAENLTELLTNSVNMTSVYYDLFLNLTPMDVTFKQYNDNNELVNVTLPNRAKDRQICLSGEVPPEGAVVGNVGECYVDTVRQEVWFKINNSGENTGWVLALTEGSLSPLLANYVPKSRTVNGKALYSDITLNATDVSALSSTTKYGYSLDMTGINLSLKDQSGNNLSTVAVSAVGANRDLSNLTDAGNKKLVPNQSGASGKWLTSNGSTSSWANIPDTYHPDILSFQWCDHLLNNPSWLRADTFSWQPGSTYNTVYNKLVAEFNNRTGLYSWGTSDSWVGTTSETPAVGDDVYGGIPSAVVGQITAVTDTSITVNGSTYDRYATMDGGFLEGTSENFVRFYRTNTSNFKIATADQENAISTKYSSDGIAWYYILDTDNARFKLPRTKWGFKGLKTNVGDDIAESLPNHNHYAYYAGGGNSVAMTKNTYGFCGVNSNVTEAIYQGDKLIIDNASEHNSTYQDNAPVQERATQMYLYFYVGEYSQTAIEQTAGLNSELFNGKLDTNMNNITSNAGVALNNVNVRTVVEVSDKSILPRWYRVYSDGWCEQGGECTTHGYNITEKNVQFIKNYVDTNFTAICAPFSTQQSWNLSSWVALKYTDGLDIRGGVNNSSYLQQPCCWQASGYIR